MDALRRFLQTGGGKAVTFVAVILCLAAAAWSIWANIGPNTAVEDANNPVFIDAENGKTFHHKLEVGMSIPVVSPYSGHASGYIPQPCYWTKDGHVKNDPTYVLMNQDIGKSGPTFCPDCGRLVVMRNPLAVEGHRPPPTKEEWEASHHDR